MTETNNQQATDKAAMDNVIAAVYALTNPIDGSFKLLASTFDVYAEREDRMRIKRKEGSEDFIALLRKEETLSSKKARFGSDESDFEVVFRYAGGNVLIFRPGYWTEYLEREAAVLGSDRAKKRSGARPVAEEPPAEENFTPIDDRGVWNP